MTPTPQEGPQYSDLARLVMERATTAREGVDLIGELIAEHGYSTYGGNTHLIADPDEGWVVWEFAGGQGLWAAERLGPDEVRVLYPGYIEEIPADYLDNPDFAGSENLFDFAVEQGWIEEGAESLNVFEVYGSQDEGDAARTGGFKYVSQAEIEDELAAMQPVSVDEMMAMVRDPRIADDEAGYGQVADLHADTPPDLVQIWVAPTGSVAAPFNPWWLGVQEVPMEYGQHRYLTKDAASSFLNPDFREQEGTEFAGRTFKRLMYLTCTRPDAYLPIVTEMLDAFEAESMDDLAWVETAARGLLEADDAETAQSLLTYYATNRAGEALRPRRCHGRCGREPPAPDGRPDTAGGRPDQRPVAGRGDGELPGGGRSRQDARRSGGGPVKTSFARPWAGRNRPFPDCTWALRRSVVRPAIRPHTRHFFMHVTPACSRARIDLRSGMRPLRTGRLGG